jgi:hypothetical protein
MLRQMLSHIEGDSTLVYIGTSSGKQAKSHALVLTLLNFFISSSLFKPGLIMLLSGGDILRPDGPGSSLSSDPPSSPQWTYHITGPDVSHVEPDVDSGAAAGNGPSLDYRHAPVFLLDKPTIIPCVSLRIAMYWGLSNAAVILLNF